MTTQTDETDERETIVGKLLAELPVAAAQQHFRAAMVVALGDENIHLYGYLAETAGDGADRRLLIVGLLTLLERLGLTIEASGERLMTPTPSVQ